MSVSSLDGGAVKSRPARGTLRGVHRAAVQRVVREPLTHFFLIGLVLFGLSEQHRIDTDRHRIVVGPEKVAQLAAGYRAEFGADPGRATLARLTDSYIEEEVLYREGIARKLDQDDQIVRRRVVQKMRFLDEDLAGPAQPSEADIAAEYAAHSARYQAPAQVSLSHIFFAAAPGQAEAVRQRALGVLAGLGAAIERAPERGDVFPDVYDYADVGPEQARRLFGDSEISRRLFGLKPGVWAGPFRSDFGWHLVRLRSTTPARRLTLAQAHAQIVANLLAERQSRANQDRFSRLQGQYRIVRADAMKP